MSALTVAPSVDPNGWQGATRINGRGSVEGFENSINLRSIKPEGRGSGLLTGRVRNAGFARVAWFQFKAANANRELSCSNSSRWLAEQKLRSPPSRASNGIGLPQCKHAVLDPGRWEAPEARPGELNDARTGESMELVLEPMLKGKELYVHIGSKLRRFI